MIELWRQCDDEALFAVTGRSLLDMPPASDAGAPGA